MHLLALFHVKVSCDGLDYARHIPVHLQAQEQAELAQLQLAKKRALEQRDAQMRQLDDLKARILAERYDSSSDIWADQQTA